MGAPTIFQRTGLTQADLEAKYDDIGSLRALAAVLNISKTTLHKYLKHKTKDTKPWDAARHGEPTHNIDYLRMKYRREAMESFEKALLHRKFWTDVTGRKIPREAINKITVNPPAKLSPIMQVYATLRGSGQKVIFVFHPNVEWVTDPKAEHSSDAEDRHTYSRQP